MVPLRFTLKIPYEEYEGFPELVELSEKDVGRRNVNVLDEAVRFYNYPSGGHGGIYADPKHWPLFNLVNITKATNQLHTVLKNEVIVMIKKLYQSRTLASDIKSDKKGDYNLSIQSDRGKICAALFVSPDLRSEKMVTLLKKQPEMVCFREFEKLAGAMCKLRALSAEETEGRIASQYRNSELKRNGLLNNALFGVGWGGAWFVKPKYIRDKTQIRKWHPERPIWPYGPQEVGPTELLYFCLQSTLFEKQRRASYGQSANFINRTRNPFLSEIRSLCAAVEDIMPSHSRNDTSLTLWRQWETNLDHLAYVFDTAANFQHDAWIEWKTEIAVLRRRIKHGGVGAGLPAASGLVGILRTYIADLRARTLMTAVSSAIADIYEEVSGYTAMGFYEALSGRNSIAPYGMDTVLDQNTIGSLQQFRTWPYATTRELVPSWVDSKINQDVSQHFQEIHNRPLISEKHLRNIPGYKKQKETTGDVTFDSFWKDYIPRFPIITKAFFTKYLGVEPVGYKNEREYAAELNAQAHIFAAYQILNISENILQWDLKKHKQQYKTAEDANKGILKGRFPTFLITDGSNIWGGRNLPHYTHRHGVEFDFDFGPNLISWPNTKISKWIGRIQKIPEGKAWLKLFLARRLKEKRPGRMKVLAICYTKELEMKSKGRIPYNPPLNFWPLAKQLVYEQIKILKRAVGKEKYFTEGKLYEKAESALTGTPHFIGERDAQALGLSEYEITELADQQRVQVGHLAIMLAGPAAMVYASPVIHIRSMHAMRRLVQKDGLLFLFKIEGPIENIKEYLKAMSSGDSEEEIPERLAQAFLDSGIVLSEKPVIELAEIGSWNIFNFNTEAKYLLKTSSDDGNECLSVSFELPDDIVRSINTIVSGVGFRFAPNDHHNHWHVEFHRFIDKNCRDKKTNDPYEEFLENTLVNMFPLWCWLGVDLRGFYKYLRNYEISSHPMFIPLAKQKQRLLSRCAEYIAEYENKYGANDAGDSVTAEQQQYISISKKMCKELFAPFKKGGMLIQPTIKKEYIENSTRLPTSLKETVRQSEHIIWGPLIGKLNQLGVLGKMKLDFVEWQAILKRAEFTGDLNYEIDDVTDEEGIVA